MLKHTPYDGSSPLFRIGLEPLELKDWLEVDGQLPFYLEEKVRLTALYSEHVFAAEADTDEAQREVLNLVLSHLAEFHAQTHQREGNAIRIGERLVDLSADLPPLEIAARLVQEDLIIMRKGEEGWRLAAASLCFPSSWHLREKFSKPLHDIHRPVPGFAKGSRNAFMIERIFDNMKSELPMRRFNWSVYSDDELFHDDKNAEHLSRGDLDAGAFLRIEHQTLRKLPESGDILFTVRIHLDPFDALKKVQNSVEVCKGFVSSLRALSVEELAYKGLSDNVDGLIRRIEMLAQETENR